MRIAVHIGYQLANLKIQYLIQNSDSCSLTMLCEMFESLTVATVVAG